MNYPKITVITPSYNQGKYIETTIKSVISQNYPNLEYFIIDGGSTDNTLDIIRKYEKHITYWISEKDKGQSDAINKGLQMASGEIINWLNSDDYYEPYALFKVANTFNNERINVVAGKGRVFNHNGSLDFTEETAVYPDNLAKTIGWGHIAQPETFFRRSVVEEMGLLDTRLHYLMDRDWWIKYLFLFGLDGVIKIHDLLVNFRLHKDSKTVSQNKNFLIERDSFYFGLANAFRLYDYAYLFKNHCEINEQFKAHLLAEYDIELVEKVLNYYILLRANEFYLQGDREKTLIFLNKVKKKLLNKADRGLFQRLYFRNKYIPMFLLNFFQKKTPFVTPKLKTELVAG